MTSYAKTIWKTDCISLAYLKGEMNIEPNRHRFETNESKQLKEFLILTPSKIISKERARRKVARERLKTLRGNKQNIYKSLK